MKNKTGVIHALNFASSINWHSFKALPAISLSDDGEVCFAWDTPQVKIDLIIKTNDTFFYYVKFENGKHFQINNAPIPYLERWGLLEDLKF